MSVVTTDLESITSRLAEQMAANQEAMASLHAELQDQQGKLNELQQSKAQTQAAIQQWHGFAERSAANVLTAQQDVQHAAGTSLEASRSQALAAVREQHVKAQNELAALQANLERDNRQEQALTEQIAALQNRLAELQGANVDVLAASQRFGAEYGASLKQQGDEQVSAIDSEIAAAEVALAVLRTRKAEQVHEIIHSLAPWPALANEAAQHATPELPFMFSLIERYLNLLADIEVHADEVAGEMNKQVLDRLPRLRDIPVEQIVRRRGLRKPRAGEKLGDWIDSSGTPHFMEVDQAVDDWHTRVAVFRALVADALQRHRERMVAQALSHDDC